MSCMFCSEPAVAQEQEKEKQEQQLEHSGELYIFVVFIKHHFLVKTSGMKVPMFLSRWDLGVSYLYFD